MSRGTIQSDLYLSPEQEQMLNDNIPLVNFISREFTSRLDYRSLYSEGLIALNFAIRKFDPNNGAKFSTYAGFWIRKRMRDAINLSVRPLRGSTEANQMIQLDEVFGDDATEAADDYSCNIDISSVHSSEINDIVQKAISGAGLSEVELEVIENLYGLNGNSIATLEEIGSILCYTPSAIKAISVRAKAKIKKAMDSDLVDELSSIGFVPA